MWHNRYLFTSFVYFKILLQFCMWCLYFICLQKVWKSAWCVFCIKISEHKNSPHWVMYENVKNCCFCVSLSVPSICCVCVCVCVCMCVCMHVCLSCLFCVCAYVCTFDLIWLVIVFLLPFFHFHFNGIICTFSSLCCFIRETDNCEHLDGRC